MGVYDWQILDAANKFARLISAEPIARPRSIFSCTLIWAKASNCRFLALLVVNKIGV